MSIFYKLKKIFVEKSTDKVPSDSSSAVTYNQSKKTNLRRSSSICNCGCNGVPINRCAEGTVDYYKYKYCPARLARKAKESSKKKEVRRNTATKARVEKVKLAENVKRKTELEVKVQEQRRIKNNLPALSRAEAQRRNLRTYIGNPCSKGHSGERLTRNGECYVCKHGISSGFSSSQVSVGETVKPNIGLAQFSQRHNIPLDKFFNAAGMNKAEYTLAMAESGAIVAYNTTPCEKYGHTIRNIYGRCIVCNPAQIAFNDRANLGGWIYIAESDAGKFIKIGFTKNVNRRHADLIRNNYAGKNDWKLVYSAELSNAGRIEIEAHKRLAIYLVSGLTYQWDGKIQNSKEIFKCSAKLAEDVIQNAIADLK